LRWSSAMYDLLIAGGTVLDPSSGLHARRDVAVRDGKVAAIEESIAPNGSATVLDARGLVVTPGLVDLHTHLFWGVSHYGVEADSACLAKGVTTAIDAGSAGAQTFPGFRRYVIDVVSTRILAFENISVLGMITARVGELENIRYAAPDEAVAVAEEHRDVIVGIKVRLGYQMVGERGLPALRLARQAADRLDLPLMVHIVDLPEPLPEMLPLMRGGDIATHCFHGERNGILDSAGRVLPSVREAAERGVIFDVGHGVGSFAFDTARRAMADGLLPNTISSDLHAHNINGPVFDLATTLSKFLHLGLSLDEVIARATVAPARAIRWDGRIGSLAVGAEADIAVFELAEGRFSLVDVKGVSVDARQKLIPRHVVRGGRVVL
ncbi:MAG TPA: amidohydrolase/deacetylase family metallohydrolase, partial [Chloroflexota bacterium]|nr:amidohydrolase/deacetylase family metallohydrolase [Chloroflexota bacterium]